MRAGFPIDAAVIARNDDVVLIPEGYHPVSSPVGYTTYYLNVLAGQRAEPGRQRRPAVRVGQGQLPGDTTRGCRFTTDPITVRSRPRSMPEQYDVRLTMAQALVRFLKHQYVERDGVENPFFAGCFGIFGHGIVAGVGQALHASIPTSATTRCATSRPRVHAATAYAKVKNRLQTFACLSSIGPGATNMITGAATATINRLPVLLLPGDIFARRNVAPVLQQVESAREPGHLGQRLLQAGQPLLGPDQPAGSDC